MAVTQIATAAAALGWMFCEWLSHGKPSVLGIASGAVGPTGALAIGIAAGVRCFLAVTTLKRTIGYDDSLDVFGVHAVGGIIGALLTGVFAAETLGDTGFGSGISSIGGQVQTQAIGIIATIVYTGIVSFILLKVIDGVMGLRVNEEQEAEGLDAALHDERGYNLST